MLKSLKTSRDELVDYYKAKYPLPIASKVGPDRKYIESGGRVLLHTPANKGGKTFSWDNKNYGAIVRESSGEVYWIVEENLGDKPTEHDIIPVWTSSGSISRSGGYGIFVMPDNLPADETEPVPTKELPDDNSGINGPKISFADNSGGNANVWIMNLYGTNPLRITNITKDGEGAYFSTGSRDGRWVVYMHRYSSTSAQLMLVDLLTCKFSNMGVFTCDDPVPLTNDFYNTLPAFIDNEQVIYSCNDGGEFNHWIINVITKEKVRFTATPNLAERHVSVSPLGKQFAFIGEAGGVTDVYLCSSFDASLVRRITNIGSCSYVHWMPDGRYVVVVRDSRAYQLDTRSDSIVTEDELPNLLILSNVNNLAITPDNTIFGEDSIHGGDNICKVRDANGNVMDEIITNRSGNFIYPSIVYFGVPFPEPNAAVRPLEDTALTKDDVVSDEDEAIGSAALTMPSGRTVVLYTSDEYGSRDILMYILETDTKIRITSTSDKDYQGKLSPDGTMAVLHRQYGGNRAEIITKNLITDTETPITTDGVRVGEPEFSPDGTKIIFRSERVTGIYQLWIYDLATKTTTRFTADNFSWYDPEWKGDEILATSERGGVRSVYIISADGSNETLVVSNGARPEWLPDNTIGFIRDGNAYSINRDGTNEKLYIPGAQYLAIADDNTVYIEKAVYGDEILRAKDSSGISLDNDRISKHSGLDMYPSVGYLSDAVSLAPPVTKPDVSKLTIRPTEPLPTKTQLLQNYPNPFNPETWIPYELKEEAIVTIEVYNTAGFVIRHIDAGYQSSGFYKTRDKAIHWDGRNYLGEHVSSGVYFIHFHARDYSQTRKILMLK